MKIDVYGIDGNSTGRKVDLPDEIFGIEPNDHALYLDIKAIQANKRQGTHKAKERGEIKGSTRKIKKQKGTGTARAGSIKNPLFRGGGRTFGPKPRSYSIKLNKKVKNLARKSALATKAQAGSIKVIEDFTFDQPKTREFQNVLNNLEVSGAKSLFVLNEADQNLLLSSRNIKKTGVVLASNLNSYEIMNGGTIIFSEGSISKIKESFLNK
ncbi:MAG: 50S ribosomal protein L4 [Saprospiraceae bacterium]|nr:50S ribosomal protein L4 [Bacteroidia bacterium]MBT8230346.1 50S ribosomal protein L4 [Bacteroidia bacterium]NNF20309.1 50S ribosomal protein L4 [Saprospiraceae bacterium]NNK89005.1 50S ribosomal protein L4 [Saprospiraceae bacterium]